MCNISHLATDSPISVADLYAALNHQLNAQWRQFGIFLDVEYQLLESINSSSNGNPEECMLHLVGKWTSNQAGTGTLPRTWLTVVKAVKKTGDGVLAQELACLHGVDLPHWNWRQYIVSYTLMACHFYHLWLSVQYGILYSFNCLLYWYCLRANTHTHTYTYIHTCTHTHTHTLWLLTGHCMPSSEQ